MNPQTEFTPEEVDALRRLIPYAEQIERESEYRAARRLIITTWRQTVIAVAAVVAAGMLLKDQIVEGVRWLVR